MTQKAVLLGFKLNTISIRLDNPPETSRVTEAMLANEEIRLTSGQAHFSFRVTSVVGNRDSLRAQLRSVYFGDEKNGAIEYLSSAELVLTRADVELTGVLNFSLDDSFIEDNLRLQFETDTE